jgi:hypothetical protein
LPLRGDGPFEVSSPNSREESGPPLPAYPEGRWSFATYLTGRELDFRPPSEPLLEAMCRVQETLEEAATLLVYGRGNVQEDVDRTDGESQARSQVVQRFSYFLARAACQVHGGPEMLAAFDRAFQPKVSLEAPEFSAEGIAEAWPRGYFEDLVANPDDVTAKVAGILADAVVCAWAGAGNCVDLAPMVMVRHGPRLEEGEEACLPSTFNHQWGRLLTPHGKIDMDLWLGKPWRAHAVEDGDHAFHGQPVDERNTMNAPLLPFLAKVDEIIRQTLADLKQPQGQDARRFFDDLLASRRDEEGRVKPDRPMHAPGALLGDRFRRRALKGLERASSAEARAGGAANSHGESPPLIAGLHALVGARRAGIDVRPSTAKVVEARILEELRDYEDGEVASGEPVQAHAGGVGDTSPSSVGES